MYLCEIGRQCRRHSQPFPPRTEEKKSSGSNSTNIKEFATGVRNVVEDLTLEDATSKDYSVWVEQSQVEGTFSQPLYISPFHPLWSKAEI
ncbi:uncharacterized protein LOC116843798 isoform X2 [Odontomachus brunneus]|uniref:uncharacterized protein LOC116843798 isoform X2 n=1 Tax=Odontomachus brunneus TaxID=486640 RepID=UPI0013F28CEB|nr:uncharacterized protein LOC116843798 isoform X2 [Odontomachus brunneus]